MSVGTVGEDFESSLKDATDLESWQSACANRQEWSCWWRQQQFIVCQAVGGKIIWPGRAVEEFRVISYRTGPSGVGPRRRIPKARVILSDAAGKSNIFAVCVVGWRGCLNQDLLDFQGFSGWRMSPGAGLVGQVFARVVRELYECPEVINCLCAKGAEKSGHVGSCRHKSGKVGCFIYVPPDSAVRFCIGLTVLGVDFRFRQPFWGLLGGRSRSITVSLGCRMS